MNHKEKPANLNRHTDISQEIIQSFERIKSLGENKLENTRDEKNEKSFYDNQIERQWMRVELDLGENHAKSRTVLSLSPKNRSSYFSRFSLNT